MNKLLLIAVICLGVSPESARSQTDKLPQLPPGPLIVKQLPDSVQYSVDYTYTDAPKPSAEAPIIAAYKKLAEQDPLVAREMADPHFVESLSPARPLHIVVTQAGTIEHDMADLERGQKSEQWIDYSAGVAVGHKLPSAPRLVVHLGDSKADEAFPEFAWITKDGFSGIENKNGHKCLVFKQNADPIAIIHPGLSAGGSIPVVAYVDLETRRPVSLQFGVETRQYTFQATAPEKLVIPDEFESAARNENQRIQNAIPHLSRP